MRPGLVFLLLAMPGAVLAAEDRYGPTRRPDPVLIAPTAAGAPTREGSGYEGRMLTWASKPAGPAPAAPIAASPPPRPPEMAARSADLPTSLYDGPATLPATPAAQPPAAQPPVAAQRAPAWSPVANTTVSPMRSAAPPQPPAAPPRQSAAWAAPTAEQALPAPPTPPPFPGGPASAYSPPRAYSVVREYGGVPDRIPTPPPASAFAGREVALDPGLLSAPREDPPEDQDETEEDPPRRPAAKERK